jgi:two-component system NarL family sensor kinase
VPFRPQRVTFTVIDVAAVTGFQLLSTNALLPLQIMMTLPVLVGLDVSRRRVVTGLACSAVDFVVAVVQDRAMMHEMGWPNVAFRFCLYTFLCISALVVVRLEQLHAEKIAGLTALRKDLLAVTMTASEETQRRISESIHDGPLQDVLAARQELVELAAEAPKEHFDRVQACLKDASERLRQATFELHPAVLEEVGLGAAVAQLSSFTAYRSGIAIVTAIDYPTRNAVDSTLFGVVRELLYNVVRHSHASDASVTLGIDDHKCRLDVVDNGVGTTGETVARRLGEGHIGLTSHRTRVEAAGGTFAFVDEPTGTHVRVELPLRN